MSAILKALDAISAHPYAACPFAKPIAAFVETGDPKKLTKRTSGFHVGGYSLVIEKLGDPHEFGVEQRRFLEALARLQQHRTLVEWVSHAIKNYPRPDEDYHGMAQAIYRSAQVSADGLPAATLDDCSSQLLRDGQPTSAGRFILSLDDSQIDQLVETNGGSGLLRLLLNAAPERVSGREEGFVHLPRTHNGKKTGEMWLCTQNCELLLEADRQKYQALVEVAFAKEKNLERKFVLGRGLLRRLGEAYRTPSYEAASRFLAEKDEWGIGHQREEAMHWIVDEFGAAALDDLIAIAIQAENAWFFSKLLTKAATVLGSDARPVAHAFLKASYPNHSPSDVMTILRQGVTLLIDWKHSADDEVIEEFLLANLTPECIKLAQRWKPERVEEPLWKLMENKSRPLRMAAAQALAVLGDKAVSRAGELLSAKKSDARSAAVALLAAVRTDAAIRLLEERLDAEPDEDVRDEILQALDLAASEKGETVSREQIAERVARARPKLPDSPAAWLPLASLPPLRWNDGKLLDADTVRYLLYRQSRAKEIRADVEARPVYELIDRQSSGDFALHVFKAFVSGKSKVEAGDRWALTLAGLLGDDRLVAPLNAQIREWADNNRGKMAEYAAQALALIGSDAALCVVDAVALRYRNKQKNVGRAAEEAFAEAAERLGISSDELGDRVVPWLGFEPGKPRLLAAGDREIEVQIGPDFKFQYFEIAKKKKLASLPSGVPAAVKAEFKELAAMLRDVVKGQVSRLENLMVRQFRWPAARWRELFLQHPILRPFAMRLVWGSYGGNVLKQCFRAMEDLTLTDETDSPVTLPEDCQIGIVHPLELDESARKAWQMHIADYEIESPFAQMERPVILPTDAERGTRMSKELFGTTLNALTFRSRAEKLGWRRGSVVDNGTVPNYVKTFPGAGADAFVTLEGLYMGIDADSVVQLETHFFVRGGSVRIGGYTWDAPDKVSDERLIPFGEVPPIVYSEVTADLRKIAGAQADAAAE